MNDIKQNFPWKVFLAGLLIAFILFILTITILVAQTPLGGTISTAVKWLFAVDSQQLWWYITRSAGILAYLLLWLSTAWGLAVPSKIISPVLDQSYTFEFHQFISLLAVGFAILHIAVLLLDRFLPYSVPQILIPFLSPYRPLWVGLGVISFYIILLVTITFYIRSRIGMGVFRTIHLLSLLGFVGITLHGLFAGTDAPLFSIQLMYKITSLSVIFLTVYWLVLKLQNRFERAEKIKLPHRKGQRS